MALRNNARSMVENDRSMCREHPVVKESTVFGMPPAGSGEVTPSSQELAARVIDALRVTGMCLATAESLTGGGVCARLVEIPGASDVVRGGVCTYTSELKRDILGVDTTLLVERGPVDGEVAAQMAQGARKLFNADYAISTTGVAGPGPADGHPAGTVYMALAMPEGTTVHYYSFVGSRNEVREYAIFHAIALLHSALQAEEAPPSASFIDSRAHPGAR